MKIQTCLLHHIENEEAKKSIEKKPISETVLEVEEQELNELEKELELEMDLDNIPFIMEGEATAEVKPSKDDLTEGDFAEALLASTPARGKGIRLTDEPPQRLDDIFSALEETFS